MNKKSKFKTIHSEARIKPEHFTKIEGESLTNQERIEDTDIKIMCAKYGLQSVLAKCEVTEPMYGWDLTETTDINERLEIKERMKQYFYEQPAKIRKHFNDKFDKFYEMYLTGDHKQMEYLGILKKEVKNEQIHQTSTITNTQSSMESITATTNNDSQTINTTNI